MQAGSLMVIYLLTAIVMQGIGFLISRAVDYKWPTAGLLTFLILFMSAYGFAWPIAVRIPDADRRTLRTHHHTGGQTRDLPGSDTLLLNVMRPSTPAGRQHLA
jgi:hypothetical protein